MAWALRAPAAGREALERRRSALLRELVRHAYDRVRFYRDLFDRSGVHPDAIRGVDGLERLPLASKEDLRAADPAQIIARGIDAGTLVARSTSGTSGQPFVVRRTWLEQAVQHVYRLRAHRDLGVRPGDRFASLGIVRGPAPGDTKLVGRLLRGTRLYRRTRLDGFREPAVILDELHGLRPQVISGYPGVLADLADANAAGRRRPLAPRLLLSGAEVLAPHLRRRIETGFKAPVRDIYGCHEINVVAWECPIGGMLHTCDDAAIVEILKDGRPAAPGEEGEVVLTALHAFAMPFIRYRLGDLAVRGPEDCACGRPFASIGTVAGRVFEMFRLPGGKRVHAHRVGLEVVRAGPWIRQYQLVQERADRVVLHAVAGAPPDVPAVEHAVRAVLGDGVEFVVTLAERIDADPSGKVRTYRTMVP